MFPSLSKYIAEAIEAIPALSSERKAILDQVVSFIREQQDSQLPANLVFICTHNSRRSHLSQIWAATAAAHYNLPGIHTFSGGTETTAFNPRAVAAIERAGYIIDNPGGENPHYQVRYSADSSPMTCFSKVYTDASIPQEHKAAIMTCSDADENCPYVPGAKTRIPLTYRDPKEADNTPQEATRYDERSLQIATELFYVMHQVKSLS